MGRNLLPRVFPAHCHRLGGWRECGFPCVLIGGCDGEQDTTLGIFMRGLVARMSDEYFVEEIHVVCLPCFLILFLLKCGGSSSTVVIKDTVLLDIITLSFHGYFSIVLIISHYAFIF